MSQQSHFVDKKSETFSVRFRESTKEALYKKAKQEDRSISYLVEQAARKFLGMDQENDSPNQ